MLVGDQHLMGEEGKPCPLRRDARDLLIVREARNLISVVPDDRTRTDFADQFQVPVVPDFFPVQVDEFDARAMHMRILDAKLNILGQIRVARAASPRKGASEVIFQVARVPAGDDATLALNARRRFRRGRLLIWPPVPPPPWLSSGRRPTHPAGQISRPTSVGVLPSNPAIKHLTDLSLQDRSSERPCPHGARSDQKERLRRAPHVLGAPQ